MTYHLFSKLFDVDDKKWPVWNRFFLDWESKLSEFII
jgi:hypothetical protein